VLMILLLLAPLLTAALCLAPAPRWREAVSLLGAAVTLGLGITAGVRALNSGPLRTGGVIYVDALGALLLLVIAVGGFAAAVYSAGYLRADQRDGRITAAATRWYYPAFHLFIATMLATASVNNLGLLWVAVEATTLASVPLVAFYRTDAALEAAWKYVILCTVGLLIALFGVVLTYFAAQGAGLGLDWTELAGAAGRLDPEVMRLAFVFVLVGFGAKAGFAPLHTWLPDAHSQAPSPVSALLSGVQLNCALYAIFRFHVITVGAVGESFSGRLLIGFGLLSIAVAVPFIVVQRDFKRLLAYSSVEHVGLIAVAIGIGGRVALYAGVLHLINHAITKALLFFVAGDLAHGYHTYRMTRIRGVVTAMPFTGALLLAGMLAITGAPPFGVFLSEFSIVAAAFDEQRAWVGVVLLGALALVFAGFTAHLVHMAFGRPSAREAAARPGPASLIVFGPAVTAMVVLGLWVPPGVTSLIDKVAAILGGQPA
jgi:hydrogenase-4 component F